MIDKIKALLKDKARMRELVLYVVAGALTTAVNWLVYLAVTTVLGLDGYGRGESTYTLIANIGSIAAWVLSVLFAFFINKKFVFQSQEKKLGAWKEFSLFVSARVLSYLLFDLALFTVCLYLMDDKIAKLLMNVLVIVFNYAASKLVIFKKR